ncbi:MAG: alkaline phosphatase family protein [Terriglobales bacterium]
MIRLKLGLLLVVAVCLVATLAGCGGSSSSPQQAQQFTLSATSMTLAQGRSATSAITITPENGFSGSVNLAASNLPAGVTATSFSPNPATTSSTLTLTATANATTGAATVTITGTSAGMTNTTTLSVNVIVPGSIPISHVVIIFQENRSTDNLFHDPVLISRGADIASQGKSSTGQVIPLTSNTLVTNYDVGHSHSAFLDICDYNSASNSCAMDGADKIPCTGQGCPASCPQNPAVPTCPQFQYVQASDVQPYFTMAETYAFGDRMFQTNEGDSFPAHQYILSGTSRICAPPDYPCPSGITDNITISDNPDGDSRSGSSDEWAGCLAPPSAQINSIDISEPNPTSPQTLISQLCFDHPTLTDLLDTANISWKYYAPTPGSIWSAPDAIQHICVPSPAYPSETSECTGTDWNNHVVIEGSGAQILTDISAGNLAAVSWVIPTGDNSDHADNPQDNGPSWVANIVNAIGGSQYWANTAIIVTWDDWGGWYDHVPPPAILDSYEYGLRVPIIVISPYAKAAYISHQVNDFGSILKFIEEVFSLDQIDLANNPSLGFADSYTVTGDLSDFFNFNQTPLPFTEIPAALKADHFLNDKSPPTPPDTD